MESRKNKIHESFPAEKRIKEYLLNMLEDEKVICQIEEKIITDEKFFIKVSILEDLLIEDYLEEVLNNEELKRFKSAFLSKPEKTEHIRFIKLLKMFAKKMNS